VPNESWYGKKYPKHSCQQCGLEHVRIPPYEIGGNNLAPFEVIGIVEGSSRPGIKEGIEQAAAFVGLIWGFPGSQQGQYKSTVFLN